MNDSQSPESDFAKVVDAHINSPEKRAARAEERLAQTRAQAEMNTRNPQRKRAWWQLRSPHHRGDEVEEV